MTIKLSWDTIGRDEWDDLFAQIPRSNLLQSWAYGDARARYSGARVRRAIIFDGDKPIGLVQGYDRSVAGIPIAVRINRGPLCLTPLDNARVADMYGLLARHAKLWKPLVISPELESRNGHDLTLRHLGFRRLPSPGWCSAYVDLARPMAELRAALNRKWRNHLAQAERSSLHVTISCRPDAFDWMIERYRQSMAERAYTGVPIPILRDLWRDSGGLNSSVVVRVDTPSGPGSAMLFVRHGTTTTYVAGWIGEQGRRARAGYLGLWGAVGEMMRQGCGWLDLGGISETETPGVAQFKQGVQGHAYELIGSYLHL